MKELISVVVPIYNGEKYIERCLHALQKQIYTNLEIILIDDGSSDNTKLLCEEISRNSTRVKYIYQNNSGPGAARNNGIEHANGEYIAFVDCDDMVHPMYFQELFNLADKYAADLVCCNYVKGSEHDLENFLSADLAKGNEKVYEKEDALANLFYRKEITAYPWVKLIRKDKIEGVRFSTELRLGEGLLFVYQLINKCETIVYTSKQLYFYYHNVGSITNTLKEDDMRKAWALVACNILGEISEEKVLKSVRAKLFILALDYLTRMKKIKKDSDFQKQLYSAVIDYSGGVVADGNCKLNNRILGMLCIVIPPKCAINILCYLREFTKRHNIRMKKAV